MYNAINEIYDLAVGEYNLGHLLGRNLEGRTFEDMLPFWCIASQYIHIMYKNTLHSRRGIG